MDPSAKPPHKPEVIRHSGFSIQVCVPSYWTDDEVAAFAGMAKPSPTGKWLVRKEGDSLKTGYMERNPCAAHAGEGFVHIVLDA